MGYASSFEKVIDIIRCEEGTDAAHLYDVQPDNQVYPEQIIGQKLEHVDTTIVTVDGNTAEVEVMSRAVTLAEELEAPASFRMGQNRVNQTPRQFESHMAWLIGTQATKHAA